MRILMRTLAILALLTLTVQTTRHAYLLWLEPRGSVLDRFEQPARDQVSGAQSLDQLVSRYTVVRKDVDRLRASGEKRDPAAEFSGDEKEPFKSEHILRRAIEEWESGSKEIRSMRFYWTVGLVLVLAGVIAFRGANAWFGLTLMVTGFSEIVYWTCPTLLGSTVEATRLLGNKLALSTAGLAVLLAVVWLSHVFSDEATQPRGPGTKLAV